MKHAIATGTDVATVCFFDPAALPADADGRGWQTQEQMATLGKEGRMWFKETGSDGSFLFHFYIDEEIPESIRKYSDDPQATGRFSVPSGTLCACGAEYVARDPLKVGLKCFSHMGGIFNLPSGEYSLTAWRTEWPEDMEEEALAQRLGKDALKRQQRLGVLTGFLFVSALVAGLIAAVRSLNVIGERWPASLTWLWSSAIIAGAVSVWLMKILKQIENDPRRREVVMEFPSIVVQMKRLT